MKKAKWVSVKPKIRSFKKGWKHWSCPVTGNWAIYFERMPSEILVHISKCKECQKNYEKA